MTNQEYRRFILVGDEEQEKKLDILVKKKRLSREDIILILRSLKLNPDISLEDQ